MGGRVGGERGIGGGLPEFRAGSAGRVWPSNIWVGVLDAEQRGTPLELEMDDRQWLRIPVTHYNSNRLNPCAESKDSMSDTTSSSKLRALSTVWRRDHMLQRKAVANARLARTTTSDVASFSASEDEGAAAGAVAG
ncbi:hypothetical protein BHE74_00053482 [Ensete ventricosum]|nr:hypothetical protein BHE74_00053482 [Ensete ventricosum]